MNAEESQLNGMGAEYLSYITVDDTTYLGHYEENAITEAIVVSYAKFEAGRSIEDWFLAWNIGEYEEITFSSTASFRIRKFNPVEVEEFNRVKGKLFRAKRFALNYWENEVYAKHM